MSPEERFKELLDSLPSTAIGINLKFRREGITGVRGQTDSCPIAAFLRMHGFDPIVGCRSTKVRYVNVLYENTPAMKKFIKSFDGGKLGYRQLQRS